jgi:hemerythrin-like domain-containing protein
MNAPASRTHSTLYLYMTRSHDYLRELLTRLLAAMEAGDRDDTRKLWGELERGLLSHMEAEERFVFPVFAHVDREEARALLAEHGLLRDQLLQLGIAVDLHYIRYEASREFAQLLERHAGREENLLYRWADQRLEPSVIERIRDHVGANVNRANHA